MSAIITSKYRIFASEQFLNSFSDASKNTYLFAAKPSVWSNEISPDTALDDTAQENEAFLEMLGAKKILSSDVSKIIPRTDWTTGIVYTEYSDVVDLFNLSVGTPSFFVVNSSFNVYKCLFNNSGVASTVEPSGTSTNIITTSDGYKWKFMYQVSPTDVLKFVTDDYIPVKYLLSNDGSTQWSVQTAAIDGAIDVIKVTAPGTGFTSVPTVTITGDGSGATATATVSSGGVVGISVTARGTGYHYATVTITGGGGAGATARAIIGPKGGHGSNPLKELGGYFVMIYGSFQDSESSQITVLNDYRIIGLLNKPYTFGTSTLATGLFYDMMTQLKLSSVTGGSYNPDEIVTGQTSAAIGTVVDYNSGTGLLRLTKVTGTFLAGETVQNAAVSVFGSVSTQNGTAQAGSSTTVTLSSGASATDDIYNGFRVRITSGTGSGQTRIISDYNGTTKIATVSVAWTTNPTSSSVYSVASITDAGLAPYSGDITYKENRRSINRSSGQNEKIQIVVEF